VSVTWPIATARIVLDSPDASLYPRAPSSSLGRRTHKALVEQFAYARPDLGHIDSLRRFAIPAVVVDLIVHKLSLTGPAIDDLVLEAEQTAFERGWKPALADR
jgi:hypothetical protein